MPNLGTFLGFCCKKQDTFTVFFGEIPKTKEGHKAPIGFHTMFQMPFEVLFDVVVVVFSLFFGVFLPHKQYLPRISQRIS
jgi:hypothetical protein